MEGHGGAPTGAGALLIVGGIGGCFSLILVAYNLIVLIGFLRESAKDKPSTISIVAWVVSLVSVSLGPCGFVVGLVSFFVARYEQGRIYNEESTVRSTTPCEIASMNAIVAIRDRDAVLAEARAADARIARGEARPLEGVPLGVKELENVEGLSTTKCSLLYKDAPPARQDDVHVARRAGSHGGNGAARAVVGRSLSGAAVR